MKKLILVIVAVLLAGCGGGGGGDTTTDITPQVAQKVSIVDGSWNKGYPADNGTISQNGYIAFKDGNVHDFSMIGGGYVEKYGTFVVSGDTLIISYDKQTLSGSGYAPSISGPAHSSSQPISETVSYTFAMSNGSLILTGSNGYKTICEK